MLDQSIFFCPDVLPELFPELAGIDSDPEENINREKSCFNNFRVRATEPASTSSVTFASSQTESQKLIDHNISPSLLDFSIESTPTDSGDPDCSELANCKKGKESIGGVSTNSKRTEKIQKRPCFDTFLTESVSGKIAKTRHSTLSGNCTESSRWFDRKKNNRAGTQQCRDNMRDLINHLELNIPEGELDSIKKTSRLVRFNDARKNIEATPYLLKNQALHPLVRKYGAKKLSDCIYSEVKLDFHSSELKCFSHLKKNISNAIAAKESRAIKSEYVKLLQSAYK
ncbi:hypothetical protein [Endozoicomonas sp.]|uniref:hypothetical protein n=1 Tax=Endozoicomonas sp. TaxID=1892382 RepID=UPI0028870EB3|nr:hypothetical protein [Endozoicomonas sp.]